MQELTLVIRLSGICVVGAALVGCRGGGSTDDETVDAGEDEDHTTSESGETSGSSDEGTTEEGSDTGTTGGEGGDDDDTPAAPLDPIWVDESAFRDSHGRSVLLRGVNARVEGIFDVTFDDGRIALEPIPELTAADCKAMSRMGFNVLRLPVNWSAIEPERDVFDEDYLVRIDAAIECANTEGIYVIVDLHQDAYSKEIGEDGAPLWAIVPEPEELLEGPLTAAELLRRRLSAQVQNAFATFFDAGDVEGLQAEFLDVLELLAERYAEDPGVVGFDLFNEPVAHVANVVSFNIAAATRIREVAPERLVFFEPSSDRVLGDAEPVDDGPFPVEGSVYAPHIYTYATFDPANKLETITKEDLRPSHAAAHEETLAWRTPMFIGEWGAGPSTTNYQLYLRYQAELHDEFLSSTAMWLWKEESQGSWGFYTKNSDDSWTLRPAMVDVVSRPYAQRIGGTLTFMQFAEDTLTVRFEDASSAPHVIYVPQRLEVTRVTCDGTEVGSVFSRRLLTFLCSGDDAHEIVVHF